MASRMPFRYGGNGGGGSRTRVGLVDSGPRLDGALPREASGSPPGGFCLARLVARPSWVKAVCGISGHLFGTRVLYKERQMTTGEGWDGRAAGERARGQGGTPPKGP